MPRPARSVHPHIHSQMRQWQGQDQVNIIVNVKRGKPGGAHNISMTRPGNFPLCRAKAAEDEESKHCTPSSRPSPQGEGESSAASLKNLRRDWPNGQPIIWKRAKGVPSPPCRAVAERRRTGEKVRMRASQTTNFPILPARYCPKWSFEFIRQMHFQGTFTGFIVNVTGLLRVCNGKCYGLSR